MWPIGVHASTDFTVWCPQIEFMNLAFMQRAVVIAFAQAAAETHIVSGPAARIPEDNAIGFRQRRENLRGRRGDRKFQFKGRHVKKQAIRNV